MIYPMSCLLQLQTLWTFLKPLADRMEVIRIAGYTEDEKLEIAKRHCVEKTKENNGSN